jgi:hypothetical protein
MLFQLLDASLIITSDDDVININKDKYGRLITIVSE